MSALNVIVQGDAAHLITDAAGCVAGRMLSLTPKTFLYPHLGIAAGFRGHVGVMRSLSFLLGQYPDRAAMVRSLPSDFERQYRIRRKLLPSVFNFDLGIVGFDGAPFGWLFSSVDRPGFPAFQFNAARPALFTPNAGEKATARAGDLIAADDVDAAALAVLDGQRLVQDVIVGGYAQITSVDEDGFNTRLLARWPDERGKVVDRSARRVAVKPSVTSRPIQRDWRSA